jgi:hypothetical protein
MNKLKIIILASLALISLNASAFDDKQVTYDGKGIVITDVYNGKGPKINTSKLQKGVYLMASNAMYLPGYREDPEFKNTVGLIKTFFESKGLKVVDEPEKADVSLTFSVMKSFDTADVEKAAGVGSVAHVDAGSVIQAITTGGMSLIGSLGSGKKSIVFTHVVTNPRKLESKGKSTVEPGDGGELQMQGISIDYKLDSKNEAASSTVFKMVLDQWFDFFIVQDAPLAKATVAASSEVPATATKETNPK